MAAVPPGASARASVSKSDRRPTNRGLAASGITETGSNVAGGGTCSSGMDASFPDALSDIYARAIAAGYGEEDIAALMKVLRRLA